LKSFATRGALTATAGTVLAGLLASAFLVPNLPPATAADATCTWMDKSLSAESRASKLVAAMPLDEKVTMVTGIGGFGGGNVNPAAAGLIQGNEALCIPPLVMQDATAGLGDTQVLTTAFPDSIGLAATFDRDPSQQFG
jgi:beta-glucosidase